MKMPIPHSVRQRLLALLFAATCLAWSGGARADTRIYMNFNNKIPKGSVVAQGFTDTIELTAIQFGTARNIPPPSSGQNRVAGSPFISEVTVTLPYDALVYADLFLASCVGAPVPVKISTVVLINSGSFVPLEIELENVLISNFNSGASTGDTGAGFLSLSLNFTKITVKTVALDPATGQPKSPVTKFYDLATGLGG